MRYLLVLVFISFFIESTYAKNCPVGYFPVRSHYRNAYTKSDGTNVSATTVKEQCRPYRVLKKPEPKFFSNAPKDWPNPKEKFKGFTKEEKARILSVIKELPKYLTYIGEIKFYRSNENSSNPAVSNSENQIIVLYDRYSTHELKRVISHELAHIYWDAMEKYEQDVYQVVSGWVTAREDYSKPVLIRKDVLIQDSYMSPDEDFTNNVELYLTDKKQLSNSPMIINFLEKILE